MRMVPNQIAIPQALAAFTLAGKLTWLAWSSSLFACCLVCAVRYFQSKYSFSNVASELLIWVSQAMSVRRVL